MKKTMYKDIEERITLQFSFLRTKNLEKKIFFIY